MKKYQLALGNFSYWIEGKWNALPEEVKMILQLIGFAIAVSLGLLLVTA